MAEWFREWFGEEYLALYPHRDEADAARLVDLLWRSIAWQPGWRVLDVACGPGRHARALEMQGASVVGLDLSASLLRRARQVTGAPLIRADMRAIPIRPGTMDLTVNLFTSFGYFANDAEHMTALAEMVATLKPGGWFAIDFLNARTVRATLEPRTEAELAGQRVAITRRLTDGERYVVKEIRTMDGRCYTERVRLFDAGDLDEMMQAVGLDTVARFGDYGGGALAADSPRVILLGRRRSP
jgi:SAM-dependent methyltransferase